MLTHLITAWHVLFVVLAVIAYLLFVFSRPVGRCRRCHGEKMIKLGKRRRVKCPLCKGAGHRRRFGARLVHSYVQSVAGDWFADRYAARHQGPADK